MGDALRALAAFDPLAPQGAPGAARGGEQSALALPYMTIDVFSERPLEGNALALIAGGDMLSGEEMQRIARELSLSETVFALAPRGAGDARLRIFTPAVELPIAGHPVLGSAIALGAALGAPRVVLETAAGEVPVELEPARGRVGAGRMRQPAPRFAATAQAAELLAALGLQGSALPLEGAVNGPRYAFVALASERALARLAPDLRALAALAAGGAEGPQGIACFAGAGARWAMRVFLPAIGVDEDPATGSAAGPLAAYLARHGLIACGEEIEIRQGAEIGRPSLLRAGAHGAPAALTHVEVAGAAVIVARGVLAPRR